MYNEVMRFILVGVFNTFVGVSTMFSFYHFFHLGYWGSSALSYTLASIISFFLNKNFTFKNRGSYFSTGIKFAVNIGICYFIAYLIAKPFVGYFLLSIGYNLKNSVIEQIAMLVGMVIFTGLNFFGQKLFVFDK